MKKRNVILCAGVLSMAMLCGCGDKSKEENSATATPEVTQEAATQETTEVDATEEATQETAEVEATEAATQEAEGTVDAGEENDAEFAAIMTAIYGVTADSADVEKVADEFAAYALRTGSGSSSSLFQAKASEWFNTMTETEGNDIRSAFGESFKLVATAAQEKDENLEFDVNYTNVYYGISAAIEE